MYLKIRADEIFGNVAAMSEEKAKKISDEARCCSSFL
jgi:hypothetical protein